MKRILPLVLIVAMATTAFAAKPNVSNGSATGQVGVPFSFQMTATNDATSYNAAGLPPGLSLDRATGLISGTPTANGTYTVTASANNTAAGGLRARVTFSIAQ